MTPPRRPDAPASLADVAQAAGVSSATVSRVVNGLTHRASPETVERVRAAVAALDYRPNLAGRSLRRRESELVALLAPNLDNPAMAAMAASIEAALRRAGLVTILCDTHDRADLQDEYLSAMRAQAVRGFVLVAALASPGLREAMARRAAMVFVNRRNPMGAGAFVGVDNRAAGEAAADHLIGLDLHDVAALAPQAPSSTIAERVEGFRARMAAHGTTASLHFGDGAGHLDFGAGAARALLEARNWPQGLFCPSDLMAYGAWRVARESGVGPGRIVAVDGNPINEWLAPWLTSVRVPYPSFGAHVAEALSELWARGATADRILPHELAPNQTARHDEAARRPAPNHGGDALLAQALPYGTRDGITDPA
jgi:LacI family transcriptional regulator